MKKRYIVLAILVVLLISFWNLLVYVVPLGYHQLNILWRAKPIETFLNDVHFPDSLKERLRWVQEIRRFGIDSLGLSDTKNYTTLYWQKEKHIMWVVQAAPPFDLTPKLWHFPIAGDVPYKGYFSEDGAQTEATKLKEEGYDVAIRHPSGWSTLGWFRDPILSPMLLQEEGDIASLILHEMTHATVYQKNNSDWNENVAEFVGDSAAYLYLKSKYGMDSKKYQTHFLREREYQHYVTHCMRGAKALDSLYHHFSPKLSIAEKQKQKKEMMEKFVKNMDTLHLFFPKKWKELPNNTFFMSFRLYYQKRHVV